MKFESIIVAVAAMVIIFFVVKKFATELEKFGGSYNSSEQISNSIENENNTNNTVDISAIKELNNE